MQRPLQSLWLSGDACTEQLKSDIALAHAEVTWSRKKPSTHQFISRSTRLLVEVTLSARVLGGNSPSQADAETFLRPGFVLGMRRAIYGWLIQSKALNDKHQVQRNENYSHMRHQRGGDEVFRQCEEDHGRVRTGVQNRWPNDRVPAALEDERHRIRQQRRKQDRRKTDRPTSGHLLER